MAFWIHRGGLKWDSEVNLCNTDQVLDLYIFSSGPSLSEVNMKMFDDAPVYKMGINTTYPKIKPDLWIGLDRPECFNENLWLERFPKILNGNYSDTKIGKIKLRDYCNVIFADFIKSGKTHYDSCKLLFDNTRKEARLLWSKNTLVAALHMGILMGFKKIHMLGSDFGGKNDYFDESESARPKNFAFKDEKIDKDSPSGGISEEQRKVNRRLYKQQLAFLQELIPLCKARGIDIISCTKDSPLNQFTEFISPDIAVEASIKRLNDKVKS